MRSNKKTASIQKKSITKKITKNIKEDVNEEESGDIGCPGGNCFYVKYGYVKTMEEFEIVASIFRDLGINVYDRKEDGKDVIFLVSERVDRKSDADKLAEEYQKKLSPFLRSILKRIDHSG